MKHLIFSAFLGAVVIWSHLATAGELNILFLGNSLTGVNNLPAQLRMMAESNGHRPYVEAHLRFGQPLSVHLADPAVAAALKSRAWDGIILQDYSNLILTDKSAVEQHVRDVQALVPSTSVLIAENWAYSTAPAGTQDEINLRYRAVANATHAKLIELGAAFESLKSVAPTHVYLPSDDRHPTPLTTMMLARIYLDHFYGETYSGSLGSNDTTPSVFDGEASAFKGYDLRTEFSAREIDATKNLPRLRARRCDALFISR